MLIEENINGKLSFKQFILGYAADRKQPYAFSSGVAVASTNYVNEELTELKTHYKDILGFSEKRKIEYSKGMLRINTRNLEKLENEVNNKNAEIKKLSKLNKEVKNWEYSCKDNSRVYSLAQTIKEDIIKRIQSLISSVGKLTEKVNVYKYDIEVQLEHEDHYWRERIHTILTIVKEKEIELASSYTLNPTTSFVEEIEKTL
jgi:hypothetical protein